MARSSGSQAKDGHIVNIIRFLKSSTLPYIFDKNLMHGYGVHEGLYLNGVIHAPWVRSSDPRAGPI